MLRIFGHFVPIPAVVIGLCEVLLIAAAIYFATVPTPALAGQFHIASSSIQFSLGMSAIATVAMGAVGLYNYDVFLDSRLMITKGLLALAMVVPAATIGGLFLTRDILGGLADSWHALVFKSAAAWMGCVVVTRVALMRFSDIQVFRRGVVVLGTGVRAERIAELARRHANHYFEPRGLVRIAQDNLTNAEQIFSVIYRKHPEFTVAGRNLAQVAGLCGVTPDLIFRAPRPGDVRLSIGEPTRAEKQFGLRAEMPLDDGLMQTLASQKTRLAARVRYA